MKLQQIYSLIRQATEQYHMITAGDKIAVGVSGGKDSIALLYALAGYQKFSPTPFSLVAITVNLGFGIQDFEGIEKLCKKLAIPWILVDTQIADIVFETRKEQNPCSLCAKMRKGALNEAALANGCNVVAYGHHKDDVVDTMFMSLIYEGRFHTFQPKTYLSKTGLTVIRPFLFVRESNIKGFVNKERLPVLKNPCPVDNATKREYAKTMLAQINQDAPGVKERMFTAICNSSIPGWNYISKEESHEDKPELS